MYTFNKPRGRLTMSPKERYMLGPQFTLQASATAVQERPPLKKEVSCKNFEPLLAHGSTNNTPAPSTAGSAGSAGGSTGGGGPGGSGGATMLRRPTSLVDMSASMNAADTGGGSGSAHALYRQGSTGSTGRRHFPSHTDNATRGGSSSSAAFESSDGHSLSSYSTHLNTFLPGDKVLFREQLAASGVPVVYRSPEEKATNAERLNLDRRGLNACPLLESEDQLRLLNYQHNSIRRIENVDMLRRLIFLDFYDNQIDRIDGLATLRSLRVLMLGKNRIKKIENLENLTKLDVLDLHGNQIRHIEGLQHLSDLRVLNLAGNLVDSVKNLLGLNSLVELNLRRNHIHNVYEIDCLPNLQRLFLSFNNITCFEDIACVSESSSISELALDGNPFSQDASYKQTVLRFVQQLKQLDMKRVTDEERRIASVMGRKEDEKKRENTKLAVVTERRRRAINTVRKQWEKSLATSSIKPELHARHVGNIPNTDRSNTSSPDSDVGRPSSAKSAGSDKEWATNTADTAASVRPSSVGPSFGAITNMVQRITHVTEGSDPANNINIEYLSEIDGDTLKLYGLRSLDAFDRSWGFQAAGAVTNVHFHFVDFADIAKILPKIRIRFPNVLSLVFTATNIHSLSQLNALATVRRLDNLTVETEGNTVTQLSLWRPYIVFRLAHFSLKRINGAEVSVNDVVNAEKFFSPLSNLVSKIPQTRLAILLGDRKKQLLSDDRTKRSPNDVLKTFSSAAGDKPETVGRAVLTYPQTPLTSQEVTSKNSVVKSVLHSLTADAIVTNHRRAMLASDWSAVLGDLVRLAVVDMWDRHAYAKHCINVETAAVVMTTDRSTAKEQCEIQADGSVREL